MPRAIGSTRIDPTFLSFACDLLADTHTGLSGQQIIRITVGYANEYGVELPHSTGRFDAPNKRTALFENLSEFDGPQQYRILSELADHPAFSDEKRKELTQIKIRLAADYHEFSESAHPPSVSAELVEETKHWLDAFPESKKLFEQALDKYEHKIFQRNALDDLRLSLEKLLQEVLENKKSLENQLPSLGAFLKQKGASPELANMFHKLLDYYAKYQNSYVKHDDAVIEAEIGFVLNITACFMRTLAHF